MTTMTTAKALKRPASPFDTQDLERPESERAALAAMLMAIDANPAGMAEVAETITPGMFTDPLNIEIAHAIVEALEADKPGLAVVAAASRKNAAAAGTDHASVMAAVADLMEMFVGPDPVIAARMAADEVRESHRRREAVHAIQDALHAVRGGGSLESYDQAIAKLATARQAAAGQAAQGRRLEIVMADTVTSKPIEWLWPQRISGGALTLVAGYVGQAKSLLCLDMIANVTKGGRWPDASGHCRQGSAIWLGGEDGLEKAFIKRVDAAGIDKTRLAIVKGTRDRSGDDAGLVNLRHDVALLCRQLDQMTDCRVIVFDPLADYIGCDPNKREEVRPALQPLIQAANERDVAILGIMHLNKKNDAVGVQRLAGSTAFSELARHILVVGNDPSDEDKTLNRRRIMLVSKNSYGPTDCGQAFRVYSRHDDLERPAVEWIAGGVEGMDCDSLLAKPKPPGNAYHQERRGDAVDELRTILAGGEVPGTEAEAQLKAAGFGRRQIEHAADKLAVARSWGRVDGRRVSLWRLPEGDAAEPGSGRHVGTFSADEWTGF
jgi:putative DNA primase/helicase